MEFEDSPAITERDRAQAESRRVNLQPIHGDVQLKEMPQYSVRSQQQGQGRSFEFESETTAAAAQATMAGGERHHVALIIAGVVCAVFIASIILIQLTR